MYSFFQHPREIYKYSNVDSISKKFNSLRRFHYKQISDFSMFTISLWLLVIGTRVGSMSFIAMSDFLESDLGYILENVDLPRSYSDEKVKNPRLQSYLFIDKRGNVKLHDFWINRDDLFSELLSLKVSMPNLVITLIVDKNCIMDHVLNTLDLIKKAKIRRVFFLTNKITVYPAVPPINDPDTKHRGRPAIPQ